MERRSFLKLLSFGGLGFLTPKLSIPEETQPQEESSQVVSGDWEITSKFNLDGTSEPTVAEITMADGTMYRIRGRLEVEMKS